MTLTAATTPAPTVLVVPAAPWLVAPQASLQITFTNDGTPVDGIPAEDSAWAGGAPHVAVTLYAANPGAFVDLAADVAYTISRPLTDVAIDEHLSGPDATQPSHGPEATPGAVTVAELSIINQAIGMLIGRGDHPADAHATLTRHAATAGTTLPAAAAAILNSTAP